MGGVRGARRYAYGDDFDVSKANTFESRLRRTTPVGVYPPSGSSEGHLPPASPPLRFKDVPPEGERGANSPLGAGGIYDLCGNVWEWTLSLWGRDFRTPDFGYPYFERKAEREDVSAPSDVLRVLRGGAFFNDRSNARAAVRDRNRPDDRYGSSGFRVACAPISSLSTSGL